MKTTLSVTLVVRQGGGESLWLEVDLPFAPSMDMEFEHPVWDQGRKPVAISFNLEQQSFFVHFGNDELPDKNVQKDQCEMYKSHGWKFPHESE